MEKIKEKRKSRRGRNERRKNRKEKTKKEEKNGSKEGNRKMGDLRWGREDSEIRRRSEKASIKKIPRVNLCLWQKYQWEGVYQDIIGSHNWYKGKVYTKKKENISVIKKRKKRGAQVHIRTIEEKVY